MSSASRDMPRQPDMEKDSMVVERWRPSRPRAWMFRFFKAVETMDWWESMLSSEALL